MNPTVDAFLWCSVQVTLFSLLAAMLCVLVARQSAELATALLVGSIAMIALLTTVMFSPVPQWNWAAQAIPAFTSAQGVNGRDITGERTAEAWETRPSAPEVRQPQTTSPQTSRTNPEAPSPGRQLDLTPPSRTANTSTAGETAEAERTPIANTSETAATQTASQKKGDWRLTWEKVLVGAGALAIGAGLIRILLALVAITRYRRSSRPLDDPQLQLLADSIADRLGIRHGTALCETVQVATPATIGWLRPLVLLPPDWPDWSSAEREAVLAHELAHIRLHHFPQWLFSQMVLVPHYYHPLVHWLVGRLRVEQELAADAFAARALGDHGNYAAALAAVVLRPRPAAPLGSSLGLFMSHSLLARRLKMLGTTTHRNAGNPWTRAIVLGLVLSLGAAVAGIRGNRVVAEDIESPDDPNPSVEQPVLEAETRHASTTEEGPGSNGPAESSVHPSATRREAGLRDTEAEPHVLESAAPTGTYKPERDGLLTIRINGTEYLLDQKPVDSEDQNIGIAARIGTQIQQLEQQQHMLEEQLMQLKQMHRQFNQQAEQHDEGQELLPQSSQGLPRGFKAKAAGGDSNEAGDSTHQVTALLRISPQDMTDEGQLEVVRATHLSLLTSDLVLQAALRDSAIDQQQLDKSAKDEIASLRRHLQSEFIAGSELLQLGLSCNEDKIDVCRQLVDAVAKAFIRKVLDKQNKQRDMLVTYLAKLKHEIRSKMEDFRALAKEIGVGEGENVHQQLNIQRLERIENEIVRLENEALLHKIRGNESEQARVQQEFFAERLDQLAERRDEIEERLHDTQRPSIELTMRRAELDQLQEISRELALRIERKDLELQDPESITIVQPAVASRMGD